MVRTSILVPALAAALLGPAGAVAQDATPAASPGAMGTVDVTLRDVNGQHVGLATFAETPDGAVSIGVSIEGGLEPGEHGIHVHEAGVCDPSGDQPFASAGGHYNPAGVGHGGPPPQTGATGLPEATDTPAAAAATPDGDEAHAGDLGNIVAEEAGGARLQLTTDRFDLAQLNDADGSALLVHANPDDLVTDPSGNSGARVLCGVIFPPQDGGTPAAGTPLVDEAIATALTDLTDEGTPTP